jgi:uncharacterized protein (DUF1684 family)
MKHVFILLISVFPSLLSGAQQKSIYTDSIKAWQHNYTATHEVVKKKDRKYFRFFPVNPAFNMACRFEKINDSIGIIMKTSANTLQHYIKFGSISFTVSGTTCRLIVYQSSELMKNEKLKNYLFIPFTDNTTGDGSYGSGRYLDFYITDIHDNMLRVDFNKAYNPYCAYSNGFHCPIPPKENHLNVTINAGEMMFGKKH